MFDSLFISFRLGKRNRRRNRKTTCLALLWMALTYHPRAQDVSGCNSPSSVVVWYNPVLRSSQRVRSDGGRGERGAMPFLFFLVLSTLFYKISFFSLISTLSKNTLSRWNIPSPIQLLLLSWIFSLVSQLFTSLSCLFFFFRILFCLLLLNKLSEWGTKEKRKEKRVVFIFYFFH